MGTHFVRYDERAGQPLAVLEVDGSEVSFDAATLQRRIDNLSADGADVSAERRALADMRRRGGGFSHHVGPSDYDDLGGVDRAVLGDIADALTGALAQKFYAAVCDVEVAEDGYTLRSRRAMDPDTQARMREFADGFVIGCVAFLHRENR